MKKLFLFLFSIFSFVSFSFIVNAKSNITGSINVNNKWRGTSCDTCINLFEETYNKTNFAQFLYKYGLRVGDYLNEYYGTKKLIKNNEESILKRFINKILKFFRKKTK